MNQTLEDRIVGQMTGSTCGEACWRALEDVCRCSCGGRNHGCDNDGTARPYRTCQRTIKGWGGSSRNTYKLYAVIGGSWLERRDAEREAIKAAESEAEAELGIASVGWRRSDDPELPAFSRTATAGQCKWPEVAPFVGNEPPVLVWKRVA